MLFKAMTMTHKIFDLEIVGCYTLVKTAIVMVLCLSDAEVSISLQGETRG
jgi:hypothetical protein